MFVHVRHFGGGDEGSIAHVAEIWWERHQLLVLELVRNIRYQISVFDSIFVTILLFLFFFF